MTNIAALPIKQEQKPTNAKELMLFIVCARRGIRQLVTALDANHGEARKYRRQAVKLKERGGMFDGARIAMLEGLADSFSKLVRPLYVELLRIGKLVAEVGPLVDHHLTLTQLHDILNINTAERIGLAKDDGLIKLIYLHGLEDSAANRKEEDKTGPLFQASQAVFTDFLMNHAEGRKLGDSLWEPGGMFADVPTYKQAPDGSMTRQPPRLRVVPSQ